MVGISLTVIITTTITSVGNILKTTSIEKFALSPVDYHRVLSENR